MAEAGYVISPVVLTTISPQHKQGLWIVIAPDHLSQVTARFHVAVVPRVDLITERPRYPRVTWHLGNERGCEDVPGCEICAFASVRSSETVNLGNH